MTTQPRSEHVDTLVIGGGQTGLIIGHGLSQHGIDFVILDASDRIGAAWRNRWDSLRLFTQARMNGLPGMAFPASGGEFVGKDEVADFLETYAETMRLPVRSGVRVKALGSDGDEFVVETTEGTLSARNVVVAMADYQKPKTPAFASNLDPGIVQMHSSDYRDVTQLQNGNVLVVGLGNSGADIAYEVAKTHPTIVSGTEKGAIPFALESGFGRTIGTRLVRFAMVKILNTSTPMGRRVRPKNAPIWTAARAYQTQRAEPGRRRPSCTHRQRRRWNASHHRRDPPRSIKRPVVHRIRDRFRLDTPTGLR